MSTSTTSGRPNALQVRTKRAPFWAEAASSTPPSQRGWLATKPTGCPSMRPKAVIRLRANFGASSSICDPSAIPRITSFTS